MEYLIRSEHFLNEDLYFALDVESDGIDPIIVEHFLSEVFGKGSIFILP